MKLEVFISKKGTKVVKATNLHAALQLPNEQYSKNIKRWLKEVYEFENGIRRPSPLRDFAKKPSKNPVMNEYYLTVRLAKHIALNSNSKVKQKFANQLRQLENENIAPEKAITTNEVAEVIDIARKMSSIAYQAQSERLHMEFYKSKNGTPANWWKYREQLLGYSEEFWKEGALSNKELAKGLSQRELLINVDKHETIRAGVVDYYIAMGKEESEARRLGDLAKLFAEKLGLEVLDDRTDNQPATKGHREARVRDLKQNQTQQALWAS